MVLYYPTGFVIYYMLVVFIVLSIDDLLYSVNPTGLAESLFARLRLQVRLNLLRLSVTSFDLIISRISAESVTPTRIALSVEPHFGHGVLSS